MIFDVLFVVAAGWVAARGVQKLRYGSWTGPRTQGMRQRSGRSARQSFRGDRRRMWEQAKVKDWLAQRAHDRKNGTTATSKPGRGRWWSRGRQDSGESGFATVTRIDTRQGPPSPPPPAGPGRGRRYANVPRPAPEPAAAAAGAAAGGGGWIPGPLRRDSKQSQPPPAAQQQQASDGRTTTVAAGNGNGSTPNAEPFIQAVNQVHAAAASGNIHAKHGGMKACNEGSQRFSAMASMLARQMSEPGMNYGPEVTEPLAKAATHLQAAAMAFAESDTALTTLVQMSVGDLASSSRQAPAVPELSESGSH